MSRGQALARSGGVTAGTPGGSREDVCCIADLLVIVPRKVRINKRGNWRKSCARLLVRVMVAQAIFRSRLAPVVRRSRAVPQKAPLEAGMWLVGTVYNFCRAHRSLRLPNNAGMVGGHPPLDRADPSSGRGTHRSLCWSLYELLVFGVPPSPPKRRGRRPRWLLESAHAA
jgi:hypothetical protein